LRTSWPGLRVPLWKAGRPPGLPSIGDGWVTSLLLWRSCPSVFGISWLIAECVQLFGGRRGMSPRSRCTKWCVQPAGGLAAGAVNVSVVSETAASTLVALPCV
jgi:hypothetical protein